MLDRAVECRIYRASSYRFTKYISSALKTQDSSAEGLLIMLLAIFFIRSSLVLYIFCVKLCYTSGGATNKSHSKPHPNYQTWFSWGCFIYSVVVRYCIKLVSSDIHQKSFKQFRARIVRGRNRTLWQIVLNNLNI